MRQTLVIADDEAGFRTLVNKFASRRGWDVVECENGAELLDTLPGLSADAVLLVDIMMPEVDGLEAITKLAKHASGQPLYFVTGGERVYADIAQHLSKKNGLNLQDVLHKPLPLDELGQLLDAHSVQD